MALEATLISHRGTPISNQILGSPPGVLQLTGRRFLWSMHPPLKRNFTCGEIFQALQDRFLVGSSTIDCTLRICQSLAESMHLESAV